VAALLSGCSKSEPVAPLAGDEGGEIGVRSSVTDVTTAPSRTPYEGTDLVAKNLKALVVTSLTDKNYSALHGQGKMTFKGGTYTVYDKPMDSGSFKYDDYTNTPSKPHYLTGLYPYEGWTNNAGTYELTLNGKEDVMLAKQIITTYEEVSAVTPTYKTLAFEHKLTLLKLKFIQENDLGIKLNTVNVTDALGGLKTKALAKISQASQEVVLDESGSFPSYKWGSDEAVTGADYAVPNEDDAPTEPYAYVLVSPVTASDAAGDIEYTFEISYVDEDGEDITVEVGVDLGHRTDPADQTAAGGLVTSDTKGVAYEIEFKFVKAYIRCTASVSNWGTGKDTDYEI
jgi:hypothetical protein